MELEVYTFEIAEGEPDTFTTLDIEEARTYARMYSRRLIANTFEWTGDEIVEDNTQAEGSES